MKAPDQQTRDSWKQRKDQKHSPSAIAFHQEIRCSSTEAKADGQHGDAE
jgi:hypothetical protein